MGRVETAYAMAPENASNSCLAHARGLFGRLCGSPEIEDPLRAKVVDELEHLRIVAPELIAQPVGESDALRLEFFVDARPFSELDNERLNDDQLTEQMHVGPEAIREHIGIEAVILGLGDREAVTETIELFGVDGIDIEAALEQGLHDWAVWGLYGDMDLAGLATTRFQKPGDHVAETGAAMGELALSYLVALCIAECDDMLLRCPVNTDKPSSCIVQSL